MHYVVYKGMKFADKLRTLRETARLSQEEVGIYVGLAQSRISRWEKGEGMPKITQALRLAKGLNVSLDFLLDDALDEPAKGTGITADEMAVIRMMRHRGLTMEQALDRLGCDPGAPLTGTPAPHPEDAQPPSKSRKPRSVG